MDRDDVSGSCMKVCPHASMCVSLIRGFSHLKVMENHLNNNRTTIENKSQILKIQYYISQCSVLLNMNQSTSVFLYDTVLFYEITCRLNIHKASSLPSSLQMLEISVVYIGLFVTSLNICGSPLTEGNESQKLNCVRLKRYCANCSQML